MNNPTVSVITPVFNASATIHESVESILSQNHDDFELILINDASTDDSHKILKSFAALDSRIKLINNMSNLGPSFSRNLGISHSKGRFLAFCDSDDVWLPNKLSTQLDVMQNECAAVCCSAYVAFDDALTIGHVISPPKNIFYNDLLRYNYIGCSTAVIDRAHTGDVIFPDVRRAEDYALWLQISFFKYKIIGVQETLVRYRISPSGESSNKIKAAFGHFMALWEREDIGILRTAMLFVVYIYLGLKRNRALRFSINSREKI